MTGYLELDFLCGADGEIDFLESQGSSSLRPRSRSCTPCEDVLRRGSVRSQVNLGGHFTLDGARLHVIGVHPKRGKVTPPAC
jgi:hypothetical protein